MPGIDRRKSDEPLLVGINIKVSEKEVAAFEEFAKRHLFKSKSSAGRFLLIKALREEGFPIGGKAP